MKKFKKISALLLALIMVFAMAVPSFAAEYTDAQKAAGETATAADHTTLTVTGADDATAVVGYKLIAPDYSGTDGKWTGQYVWAKGIYTPADATAGTDASGILADAGYTEAQVKDLWTAMTTSASTINADDVSKIASAFAANARKAAADQISVDSVTFTKQTNGNYTADAGAGQYIVLASGGNSTIYNPMVVAAAYDKTGNVDGPGWADSTGTVSTGTADADQYEVGTTVKAKKTTITANKKQLGAAGYYLDPITEEQAADLEASEVVDENGKQWATGAGQRYVVKRYETAKNVEGGDDVQIGDVIDFQLDAMIPNYNTAIYKNPYFSVGDTLEATSFEGLGNIKVYVGDSVAAVEAAIANETATEVASSNYTITPSTLTNEFKVKFTPTFINGNLGKVVVIRYQAKLKTGATVNYDANNNTMTVEYSNNPNRDYSTQPNDGDEDILDFTNTYTFEIDLLKTNEKNKGEDGYKALAGAKFQLYRDPACTIKVGDEVESADGENGTTLGAFGFSGLNAGTYYLKETKAPDGYQANDKVYKIVITPNYGDPSDTKTEKKFDVAYKETVEGVEKTFYMYKNGTTEEKTYTDKDGNVYGPFEKPTTVHEHTFELKSVSVQMTGDGSANGQTVSITKDDGQSQDLIVKNSPMAELPSTGGIGTYIFTVIGVALLAVASFMLIFKRRKAEK